MKKRIKTALILLGIGVAVNIALAIVKMYVGLSSNSLMIMLDAMNSFFDIITTAVAVFAFVALIVPRSEKAPHGYGRSEYLASFVVAVVSVVMGGLFFIRSLNRMAMPEPVWFGAESCALIAVAIPVKLAIAISYKLFNKKLRSKAIEAISIDSFLDAAITTASLISFVVSSRVNYAVDAIFGIVTSIVVILFAIKAVVDSVKSVVRGDDGDIRQDVETALNEVAGIKRIVSVDVHDYGYGEKDVSAFVEFEDGASALDVASLSREVEDKYTERVRPDFVVNIRLIPSCESAPAQETSSGAEDGNRSEGDIQTESGSQAESKNLPEVSIQTEAPHGEVASREEIEYSLQSENQE